MESADAKFVNNLPAWAGSLARKYLSHTVSQFVLHGAVRDLVPYSENGQTKYHRLGPFLEEVLFAGRDYCLRYDRSRGLTFPDHRTSSDFAAFIHANDTATGSAYGKKGIPRDPAGVLGLVERYLRTRLTEGKSVALILDYAEMIFPRGDTGYMSDSDRAALVTLLRWADDPDILAADVTVVLVCQNLAMLNETIIASPFSAPVEIPLPDHGERLAFIEDQLKTEKYKSALDVTTETFAELTSGLSRIQIGQVLSEAARSKAPVGTAYLMERKKEIIEAECYGLIEFFKPRFTLDMVAGHKQAKQELRDAAMLLKKGRLDVLPMGYLITGPIGTGKTFMTTCFAGEIGIPCVKILNIRSQWQGVTEANLQKLLTIFKAMGPLAVMIDEADAFLGDRDASGDSGTSSRMFSEIASFMSNTDYRGKITWFLLTARPDLLPVDIKRQGRAEEHIALFHPESTEDRDELFEVFLKKNGVETRVKSIEDAYQKAGAPTLSGADLEAIVIRSKRLAAVDGRTAVTKADFAEAFAQFSPPVYAEALEYQTLVAVAECTNRKLIPKEYRDLPRAELTARIAKLKIHLG
jgi:SpoVK/Ycf46/Vps4 family AAA+-type ATPase